MKQWKKKITGVIIMCIMVFASSITALALSAENSESSDATVLEIPVTTGVTTTDITNRSFPGNAGILRVDVYPADSKTNVYYSAYTSAISNSGTQWLDVTLDSDTADVYKSMGCDSFYVEATIYGDMALFYDLFINKERVGTGSCTRIPNAAMTFKMLVPNNVSYPGWRIELRNGNYGTQAMPLSGYINMR